MDLQNRIPVVIYDDKCYLCAKFAEIINLFARGRVLIVGHYSDIGMKFKSEIFPQDYDSTKMFWFVDSKTAYGGRAALIPLISSILTSKIKSSVQWSIQSSCSMECKTPKAVFLRSKSLFTSSEKIPLKD
jgi:predicted DCC family thiol-disulfide oxidoreductase YuxK